MADETQTHDHVPSRLEFLPALDGLRGLAAALVVLTHAAFLTGFGTSAGLPGHLLARGDFGVGIFFALSGFLLHCGLLHEVASTGGIDTLRYAARRIARIFPAYWLALAAVVIAADPGLKAWLLSAVGLQIYAPDTAIGSFGQAWSVATEASFYVVLPVVVVLLHRLRGRSPAAPVIVLVAALALTSLLPLSTSAAVFGQDLLVERWLPWRAPHFLVGMICAEALVLPRHPVTRTLRRWARDPTGCLLIAGAAYLAATTPVAGSLSLEPAFGVTLFMRTGLATLVAAGVVLPLVMGTTSGWSRLLAQPVMRWLGLVSYGLFLWHLPVFTAVYAVTGAEFFRGGILPLLSFGVPISLLLAFLSHQFVELPSSRLVARLLGRRHDGGEPHHREQHDPDRALEHRPAE